MDLGAVLKDKLSFRTTSGQTSGVAKCRTSIWLPLQMDLGGVQKPLGRLATPQDRPRGCPKGNPPFGHGWAYLWVVLNVVTAFRTTSRQTSGSLNVVSAFGDPSRWNSGGTVLPQGHFCTPPDRPRGSLKGGVPFRYPLPDFPVHRGHRISTYRLPIDNSLSFPCLDGQC